MSARQAGARADDGGGRLLSRQEARALTDRVLKMSGRLIRPA